MENRTQLVRTCSACGIQKPLSAFLQVSGAHGTTYGNICSTCRSEGVREKPVIPIPDEDRGSTTSRSHIGAKQRVEMEKEHKRQLQLEQTSDIEEAKKTEALTSEKNERSESALLEEKKLRAKQSFLNFQSKKIPANLLRQKAGDASVFTNTNVNSEAVRTLDAAKLETAIQEELRNTRLDLSNAFSSTQDRDARFQNNPLLESFLNWVGPNAALFKALGRHKNLKQDKPSTTPTNQQTQQPTNKRRG